MKTEMDYTITSKQLIFTLISCMLGGGVLALPRVTAEAIGQDAWLVVILGGIVPFVSIWMLTGIINKYPGISFVALTEKLAGRFLSRLMAAVFVIYSIIASGAIIRLYAEVITMFLLPDTPMLVKILSGLSVSAYMASSGIKVLGRLNEFLFYVLISPVFLSIPAVLNFGDVHYLMPVLNHTIKEYSTAALTTSFAFSGFETLIIFGPYVIKKKEILKAGILALSITAFIYLYVVVTTLIVFGPDLMQVFTWPALRLLSVTDIPVLERIEFISIIAWIGVAIKPASNQYFCAGLIIKDAFGIKTLRAVVALLYPIIAFVAIYPQNIEMVFSLSEFVGTYSLILGIIFPLVLLGLSAVRGKGRVKDEGNL